MCLLNNVITTLPVVEVPPWPLSCIFTAMPVSSLILPNIKEPDLYLEDKKFTYQTHATCAADMSPWWTDGGSIHLEMIPIV